MSEAVVFQTNAATATQIAEHLLRCDVRFIPRLSARVDIADYAIKIADRSVRFEAWHEGALIGLVAAYADLSEHRIAFITSVSVLAGWSRRGIGTRLVRDCVAYATQLRLHAVGLEVNDQNRSAIRLYESLGFSSREARGESIFMHLDLQSIDRR
ncbi:MAG TPA: GNAT family N-acetyltransferase [Steroidobacteraceae bacterium]|jgi:ribosomal protein S18 acetylase RimI-like enzyme